MKQEAHWDIAWQIFDEVNKENDTERFIDLQDIGTGFGCIYVNSGSRDQGLSRFGGVG
jgi:hypothetical protein